MRAPPELAGRVTRSPTSPAAEQVLIECVDADFLVEFRDVDDIVLRVEADGVGLREVSPLCDVLAVGVEDLNPAVVPVAHPDPVVAVDADGVDDLAIGAPDNDAGGTSAGIAYLVYGPFSGSSSLASADAYLLGSGDSTLGRSIALGDSNGDAYDDLFTGAPGSDTDGTDAGAALLLVGTGL